MTILYSFYTDQGILFAADSAVVVRRRGQTTVVRRDAKVLKVPRLGVHADGGLIGYFGLAQVAGEPMTTWLKRLIARWQGSRDVGDFTQHLETSLASSLRGAERRQVSGFHVGAFEMRERVRVPVFWFIWNFTDVTPEGVYTGIREYRREEQLLGRDFAQVRPADVRSELETFQTSRGMPIWYRNGDLPFFSPFTNALQLVIGQMTLSQPRRYRSPTDIEGWRRLLLTLLRTTGELYRVLYRVGDPPIGGPYRCISLAR